MRIYYMQWPDRDELYIPRQGFVEINYGGFFREKIKYYWKNNPNAIRLRDDLAVRRGVVHGKVLDQGKVEIQLPLRDGSIDISREIVREILNASAENELASIVNALVREKLAGIFTRLELERCH